MQGDGMLMALDFVLRAVLFLFGLFVVAATLLSAVRTFVLPRSAPDKLVRVVFLSIRWLFDLRIRRAKAYSERDRIMALYAPISLLALLPVWYFLIMVGYLLMFRALGTPTWYLAFHQSISSLMTLGFEPVEGWVLSMLVFSESIIGLMMVALLLAYLPAIYSAFSRRESAVTLLEVRAGDPPSAVEMIKRYHRIQGLERLGDVWPVWEQWFAEVEESHTSLSSLVFFRSPQPNHSWVTASGAVLDAAALTLAIIETPYNPQAALCIRAGYLALRRIADFFRLQYDANPSAGDVISLTRADFDAACEELRQAGVPLKPDMEQGWRDFSGWRVNYDRVLLLLARITLAPRAPWTSEAPETDD